MLGGASWKTDELRRLVNACPSLRELHADCRTKGVGAGQLDLLIGESALRPRRLVSRPLRLRTLRCDLTEPVVLALLVPKTRACTLPEGARVRKPGARVRKPSSYPSESIP